VSGGNLSPVSSIVYSHVAHIVAVRCNSTDGRACRYVGRGHIQNGSRFPSLRCKCRWTRDITGTAEIASVRVRTFWRSRARGTGVRDTWRHAIKLPDVYWFIPENVSFELLKRRRTKPVIFRPASPLLTIHFGFRPIRWTVCQLNIGRYRMRDGTDCMMLCSKRLGHFSRLIWKPICSIFDSFGFRCIRYVVNRPDMALMSAFVS